MIVEDYVSFETAKLLKEKGFDEYCRTIYNAGVFCSIASLDCRWNEGYGELIEEKQNSDFSIYDNAISAPTLQMAMKWLREVHNLSVRPRYDEVEDEKEHLYYVWFFDILSMNPYKTLVEPIHGYSTYEEACEAGIKYCLEKLI